MMFFILIFFLVFFFVVFGISLYFRALTVYQRFGISVALLILFGMIFLLSFLINVFLNSCWSWDKDILVVGCSSK